MLGVFIARDKPLRMEQLERLSPAARAFYEYYRQAQAKNPVLHDLYKPLPGNYMPLYLSYRGYNRDGCADAEQVAYRAAANVLEEIGREPPTPFPWYWATVGMILTIMAGAVVVIYRRRIKKPSAKAISP